ncbi:MAG: hypothetical protein JWP85_675 [Rhodoglobus sp.]|nr:hypothetical protein [Rhodoglobus sp.]
MTEFADRPHLVTLPSGPAHRDIAAALASLPRSFRPGAGEDAIVYVTGDDDWPASVEHALSVARRAIVVIQPGYAQPSTVLRLAERAATDSVPVMIDYAFASNPAVVLAAAAWSAAVEPTGILDVTSRHAGDGTGPMAVLLDQLAALHSLVGPVRTIRQLHIDGDAHSAVVAIPVGGGVITATLLGARTELGSRGSRVRWLGPTEALELEVPHAGTAGPGYSRHVTTEGEQLAPTIYENAHRATLARLSRHLEAGAGRCDDLTTLAGHLELVPREHPSRSASQRTSDQRAN